MGEIVKTRTQDGKLILKIELTEEEAQQLRSHFTKVHVFARDLCKDDSKIIERGNKGGAKYFIIPLGLKSRKKKRYSKISYQKIEKDDQICFVYVAEKDPLY